MNEPESPGDNLEEIQPSRPAQEVEQEIVNRGALSFEDDFDILLNYDEDDEPRLLATGELELPSPEDCLDAYQAMMLYNFLCSQVGAPQLVFSPSDKDRPQLYDWFVSSLSICPLTELLDQLLKRLVAWKKRAASLGEGVDKEELEQMGIRDSIDWNDLPGLRA